MEAVLGFLQHYKQFTTLPCSNGIVTGFHFLHQKIRFEQLSVFPLTATKWWTFFKISLKQYTNQQSSIF
jgi:hypothetical protein